MVTYETVKADPEVRTYIVKAQQALKAIGYTEHGLRHIGLVAARAMALLQEVGAEPRRVELVGMAALLHDIGNVVNRDGHGQTSAIIGHHILVRLGLPPAEIADVLMAIGNHEEERGEPVNDVAAALILADKSDVHRSRVYNEDLATFDFHDRVNYAVTHSALVLDAEAGVVALKLEVDTEIIQLMEYFEIFLTRMVMCRRAAQKLGHRFELHMNGTRLL